MNKRIRKKKAKAEEVRKEAWRAACNESWMLPMLTLTKVEFREMYPKKSEQEDVLVIERWDSRGDLTKMYCPHHPEFNSYLNVNNPCHQKLKP